MEKETDPGRRAVGAGLARAGFATLTPSLPRQGDAIEL